MRFRKLNKSNIWVGKLRLLLYFTSANAIFGKRKNKDEKTRRAVSIMFYSTKCDRAKSKTRISGTKRKCVKTLAPAHQNHLSHFEGTQRRSENMQISWDIRSKWMCSGSKCAKILNHSLKIDVFRLRHRTPTQPGHKPTPGRVTQKTLWSRIRIRQNRMKQNPHCFENGTPGRHSAPNPPRAPFCTSFDLH